MLCNFLCSCRLLTFFQNKLFLLLFFTSHQQYLSHVRTRPPGLNQYYAECLAQRKKSFRDTINVLDSLDPDDDTYSVGPDLGPICLKMLSADELRKNYLARNNLSLFHT